MRTVLLKENSDEYHTNYRHLNFGNTLDALDASRARLVLFSPAYRQDVCVLHHCSHFNHGTSRGVYWRTVMSSQYTYEERDNWRCLQIGCEYDIAPCGGGKHYTHEVALVTCPYCKTILIKQYKENLAILEGNQENSDE